MEARGITLFFLFLFPLLILVAFFRQRSRAKPNKRCPPGPWAFPFVGSMHHMFTLQPQAALHDLSEKHGPVMYLRLGQIDTVVISSPAAAQEVLQANDVSFATRPSLIAPEIISYGKLDLAFAPYGDYWRAMRKLCVLKLLSSRKVRQFAAIRDRETMSLVAQIRANAESGGKATVNIGKLLESCTNSITALATFGDGCTLERREQFLSAVAMMVSYGSGFYATDLFPSLWIIDALTGMRRRVSRAHRQVDELLDKMIKECEVRWKERKVKIGGGEDEAVEDDLVRILLRVRDEDDLAFPFDNTNIKAIIVDLFIAGTETISSTAEWLMSELMRHPAILAKAQEEVRLALKNVVPHHHESRMERIHYTRMVIKEILRLHPPGPLILRVCNKTCDISGFQVTKGSRMMINAWAMARSPKYWDDALEFRPTRFENNLADYNGTYFNYMPFGSGRRICPGYGFAMATLEIIVARLLYYFDWSLPGKMLPDDLDMDAVLGLTLKRRTPLHLLATPYDVPLYI